MGKKAQQPGETISPGQAQGCGAIFHGVHKNMSAPSRPGTARARLYLAIKGLAGHPLGTFFFLESSIINPIPSAPSAFWIESLAN